MLEPASLNTAPAIALAASYQLQQHDDVLCVMPADHFIRDTQHFCEVIDRSQSLALQNYLVTFGINPAYAETGYGYIEREAWIEADRSASVKRFTEKPGAQLAEQFFKDDAYYWNSGIFVFNASTYLNELSTQHLPIATKAIQSVRQAKTDLGFIQPDANAMQDCTSISIDYAVMEQCNKVAVCPMDAGWSDIGAWDAVYRLETKDAQQNVIKGDVIIDGVENTYIQAESRLVAATDVKDLVIIETSDAVLVANKNNAQSVKQIVSQLKALKRNEANHSSRVYRPWGYYETLLEQAGFKVKRVVVNPHCQLSLQSHNQRSEHWVVVHGIADITLDEKTLALKPNQSTYIPIQTKHRLANTQVKRLEVIEVQVGDYLGEDDIVRYEDVYGRVLA